MDRRLRIPQMVLEVATTKTASAVISVLDIHHDLGTGGLRPHINRIGVRDDDIRALRLGSAISCSVRPFQPLHLIFACYPAIPWASEERSEPANRRGVLVLFSDSIRIFPAPPLGESDYMAWSVLIDENLMRVKAPHIGPHLAREVKTLRLCAGL